MATNIWLTYRSLNDNYDIGFLTDATSVTMSLSRKELQGLHRLVSERLTGDQE